MLRKIMLWCDVYVHNLQAEDMEDSFGGDELKENQVSFDTREVIDQDAQGLFHRAA